MKNNDLKNIIRDSLGLNDINEAVVANKKQFSLKTEFLSQDNKNNHFDLYKGYVDAYNTVSAKLDSVDRSNVNSNHSA